MNNSARHKRVYISVVIVFESTPLIWENAQAIMRVWSKRSRMI